MIVGLADGASIASNHAHDEGNVKLGRGIGEDTLRVNELRPLVRTLEDLIDEFPKALVHQILVFDHDELPMPDRIYPVPSFAKSKTTTIKTVMCDLTSRFLAELAISAKSLQSLQSLDSPRISSTTTTSNGAASASSTSMTDVSRTGNARSFSPGGDRVKPGQRMSIPANPPSNSPSGITNPDSRPTTPSNGVRTPPTSFSEITGSSSVQSPPRPSSHDRTDSRGRASGGALGAGSLGERERNKGKGRIGVTIGAMYLLAGRWPDAVKELAQNAAIARNCSDYLWHAKAMDLVLVCLLMYAWAGMDFRVSLHHIERKNLYTHVFSSGSEAEVSRSLIIYFLVPRSPAQATLNPPNTHPLSTCRTRQSRSPQIHQIVPLLFVLLQTSCLI